MAEKNFRLFDLSLLHTDLKTWMQDRIATDNTFTSIEIFEILLQRYGMHNNLLNFPFNDDSKDEELFDSITREIKNSFLSLNLRKLHFFSYMYYMYLDENDENSYYFGLQCKIQKPHNNVRYMFTQSKLIKSNFDALFNCDMNTMRFLCVRKKQSLEPVSIANFLICLKTFFLIIEKFESQKAYKQRLYCEHFLRDKETGTLHNDDVPSNTINTMFQLCMFGLKFNTNVATLKFITDNPFPDSAFLNSKQHYLMTCYFNEDTVDDLIYLPCKPYSFLVLKLDDLNNKKKNIIPVVLVNSRTKLYLYDDNCLEKIQAVYRDQNNTTFFYYQSRIFEIQTHAKVEFISKNTTRSQSELSRTEKTFNLAFNYSSPKREYVKGSCDTQPSLRFSEEKILAPKKNQIFFPPKHAFYNFSILSKIFKAQRAGITNLRVTTTKLYQMCVEECIRDPSPSNKKHMLQISTLLKARWPIFVQNVNSVRTQFFKPLAASWASVGPRFDFPDCFQLLDPQKKQNVPGFFILNSVEIFLMRQNIKQKQVINYVNRYDMQRFVMYVKDILNDKSTDITTQQNCRHLLLLIATGLRVSEIQDSLLVFHENDLAVNSVEDIEY